MRTHRATRGVGTWPTAEQELLLSAALGAGQEALEAWHRWRARVVIEQVDPGSFRLLPLLYRNLTRFAVEDPLIPRLKGVHRQSWYRNQLLFHRTTELVRRLERASIRTLLLKGAPLSLLYYRDEAVRPMADVDLLVRVHDAPAACRLLEAEGWRSHQPCRQWPPPHRGSWGFVNEAGDEIDLHWHVFADCLAGDADDDLWEASQPFSLRGVATRALGPADQLLHVLVHGLHYNPVPSIRWLPDAAAILASTPSCDWERLIAQARRRRFVPVITVALAYLRERLGVAVPSSVLDRLRSRPLTVSARLDLWSRTHGTVAAGAWRHLDGYRRAVDAGDGRGVHPLGFYRYLRALWLADSWPQVLDIMRRKAARRLAGRMPATAHTTPSR